jgi:hypothetical protein
MKNFKSIITFSAIFCLYSINVNSQTLQELIMNCGTTVSSSNTTGTGGKYSTAGGVLRCLIVFAQFQYYDTSK